MNNLILFEQFAKGKTQLQKRSNNCVIYTRVSGKEQELGYSLETQRKTCEDYAKKHQYAVMGVFGGTYESAKTDERKEFNRMLAFVKKSREKISYIIVYSVDRFSRSGANAIYIKDQLRAQGIFLVAVTQPADTSTSSGDFQQNIQIIFSEYDNNLRREKCMAGTREALMKGEWCQRPPYGYDIMKENGKRKIVLNEKGKFLQKAFYWKANERLTHTAISERLETFGVKIPDKRLSGYFRNPFYCGLMAHSSLKGQVVEGNHEKMISKEIFLKVNDLLRENKHGYSSNEVEEGTPLKRFLRCDHCGAYMRGYIVRKKNLPYYKCNTLGCGNNKSARDLHSIFEKTLSWFSLVSNASIRKFVAKQIATKYNREHKEKDESKETIKRQITELQKKQERLEERLINEELTLELYNKFSGKFREEIIALEKNLLQNQKRVSNLEHCVNIVLDFAANLPKSWTLMGFKDKQLLQFLLFPEGIRYSKKNNECRTTKINSVFSYIAHLVRDMGQIKSGASKFLIDCPALVPRAGVEPACQ
ncbi:MAG: recombinase family protein [Bacteroidetes bacterium]|nr:recombinase family protein [Bacteroidota bacterium]